MEITDEEIGLLCKDWVESRMPSKQQMFETSQMIAFLLRTPQEHQADLDSIRRTFTPLIQNASSEKIDEVISALESDVEDMLPHLHHRAMQMMRERCEVLLSCLKGDMGNLTDSQEQRIIACIASITKYQAQRM